MNNEGKVNILIIHLALSKFNHMSFLLSEAPLKVLFYHGMNLIYISLNVLNIFKFYT